ncbi:MAG: carboxypeptidase-like regulatory domain-containing protein [Cyclobacteriaceae bacterium]|nr:carboxypeptidase-like regulatory domain-containing protein [Cyclobacteriaceae bacterium HetDA_MAG_MS6]
MPRLTLLIFLFAFQQLTAQQTSIRGVVQNQGGQGIPGASVLIKDTDKGQITDVDGFFNIGLSSLTGNSVTLVISHISFDTKEHQVSISESKNMIIKLDSAISLLKKVEISGDDENIAEPEVSTVIQIDAKAAQSIPTPFADISRVLVTLPGVASNNELSTTYSVRGGNFDENLVYVNDIPIYRPFLANSGRQEGLSFVNPDLVKDIHFYAGGWEPKYGDKLSSSLNIDYIEPQSLEGSLTVGLLGGSAYLGGSTKGRRMKYVVGIRHRDSRYLLNTLEVQGQYFPKFSDVQAMLTFDLTPKNSSYINKTKLNWLSSYSQNRYLTLPTSQQTDFGSVTQNFRLQTAFIGQENLDYDTYQTGARLTHRFSNRFQSHVIASAVYTKEKEFYEVEGAYRLCDLDNNPNSSSFDECVLVRGIGTNFSYGRNKLQAALVTIENRHELILDRNNQAEFGFGVSYHDIQDELNEYSFIDSADFITVEESTFNDLDLQTIELTGYIQNTTSLMDSVHTITYGARWHFREQNEQLLFSPRLQYRFNPKWLRRTSFRLSAGVYQQPPFYRELRDMDGDLQFNVKAQRSIHLIGGFERALTMWGRPFKFVSEIYYKKISDVIPYDVDNIRIRYFAANSAEAFATGVDFRLNGEFIRGTQSWFSLGILNTREDLVDDDRGYIRRPTDQRINLGVFFEDHMPHDPTLRVYLNMVFGSGYPLGPPGNAALRNAFKGDEYYRVDLGLSKSFTIERNKFLRTIWIRAEVLNALAADNTLSYTWIEDVTGGSFAVPNSLSARFLNIKLKADF